MDLEIPTFWVENRKPFSALVQGLQVGRYLVAPTPKGLTTLVDPNGNPVPARPWTIIHIPSRAVILSLDTLEEVLLVADDLSRFAPRDVDGTTIEAIIEQIPGLMRQWLDHCLDDGPIGFREWHDQR